MGSLHQLRVMPEPPKAREPKPADVALLVQAGMAKFARATDPLEQIMAADFILKNAFYLHASLADGDCAFTTAQEAYGAWEAVHPSSGPRAA